MSDNLTAAKMAATTFRAEISKDKAHELGNATQERLKEIGVAVRIALSILVYDDRELEALIRADDSGVFVEMLNAITDQTQSVQALDEFLTAGGARIATIFARLDPEGAAGVIEELHPEAGNAQAAGGAS